MNLSYSDWKLFAACPKHFSLVRRKVPPVIPLDDYYKLYGFLTQRFFQMFANSWRFKSPYMSPALIREKAKILWDEVLQTSVVDWSSARVTQSKEEIFDQAVMDICAIMDSQNQNHFLNTRSEIEIKVSTKDGVNITGRLDFIHYEPLNDKRVHIFDGKGAGKIGRNVDINQLYYYALLYYFHFKVVPVEVGFFYYRFNLYKPLPLDIARLNEFRARISQDIKTILEGKNIQATPNWKACQHCRYSPNCQECMAFRASRRKESKLDLPDSDGMMEFGL
jgi:CRISPR/Cas system-associated exonuclease Cas4 (RecB family)